MGKEPEDSHATREWAIAQVGGAGMVAGVGLFDLVNRVTGRGHGVSTYTLGVTYSPLNLVQTEHRLMKLVAPSASAGTPSYTLFRTRKPVNFETFDGAGVRISSLNFGIFYGYSVTYITIWDGSAYFSREIAYVEIKGWGAMLPGGSAAVHGVMVVNYGSGTPMGLVPMVLEINDFDAPSEPRLTKVQIKPHEEPRIILPSDTLFAFDSAKIQPDAVSNLRSAAKIINSRTWTNILIVGHTDSIGPESYNQKLSLLRAQAVMNWMVQHSVRGAEKFRVDGKGETDPIAPNRQPNGKDDPDGRQKNRRVEILFLH